MHPSPPAHRPPASAARRRRLLRQGLGLGGAALLASLGAPAVRAAVPAARDIALVHLHTRERIATVYAEGERYVAAALAGLNRFLRDHRSGDVGEMDPRLFDLLRRLRLELGSDRPFDVISGYRSPATNEHLRTTRGGGVSRRSLHMDGRAIDVRLPGVPLADLRDAARALRVGGVGFYPREDFVHLDTGPVRAW
jgi:uncharacterized protein YcbK (DUF882 family)